MKKITLVIAVSCQLFVMNQRAEGQYTNIVNFSGADTSGATPMGSLILSGDTLYGMTYFGGAHDSGVIFSVLTNGTGYTNLVDFNNTGTPVGAYPLGSLILSGNTIYGMTSSGGIHNYGVIFKVQTNGTGYTDLVDFNDTSAPMGAFPGGSLILSGNALYGMTGTGGIHNDGVIFSVLTNGAGYTDLVDFNDTIAPKGAGAQGSLILSGDTLYGMTTVGGAHNNGVIFKIHTDGTGYTDMVDFNGFYAPKGQRPNGSLILSGDTLYGMTELGGLGSGVIFSIHTDGTGYTDLMDFGASGSTSYRPYGDLTLSGTTLYGMTSRGGAYREGVIFSIQTNGTGYSELFECIGEDGAQPYGSLVLSGNTLYGMTSIGGPGDGVVFRYIPCNFNVTENSTLSCNGSANATATATPSGGISPYTYIWSNRQTNATATGLSAGTYTVNVTDSVGCSGSGIATITQPPLLQDSINSTCATCCNCKGTTHVYVWGGAPPYTYSWSNGRTDDTLMGLASGTYTAAVRDANGCTITDTVFVHDGPSVGFSQTNVLCNGESDGSATVVVSGSYSYSWSPGGATTATTNGLSAGSYNVTITNLDTAGCSATYNFTITQPTALSGGLTICCEPYNTFSYCADTFCYNVGAMGTGGVPPYTFDFSPGLGVTCHSEDFTTAAITDANGCVYTIPAADANIYVGLSIQVLINNNVSCNGGNNGSAVVTIPTGGLLGTFPTYSWSPGGGTNGTQANLSAGTYTVTVAGGLPSCTVSAVIAITQPPAISITADSINATTGNCDGSAWAIVNGGTAPYTYSWTGGHTTDTITNQCADDYCCTVTDANGCLDSVCVNIDISTGTNEVRGEREKVKIFPNPNSGVFTIQSSVVSGRWSVEVYNVLGQQVYSQFTTHHSPFTIDLSSQPDGVYFYRVLYENGGLMGSGKVVIEK